jgi:16S rRNA processing protein RimM
LNPSSPDAASDATAELDDLVVVARLVRPQGRHGEVLADLLTDFPDRFVERKRLTLVTATNLKKPASRTMELENYWLHQGRIVFKFAGIDSINDAETLRGLEVAIPKAARAPLEEDAVYISDLIGCVLIDSRSGTTIGEISDVDRDSTATPLLVVESSASGQVLVPFAKAYHPKIDVQAKRIEMLLPEGLLELNAPTSKYVSVKSKTED